ncbi:MAG: HEAT repeat domain-containing protein [Planctomycetes bacterium]|nr:HEAT repeat domain-containing protein [Planctomycetota bacterium]
MSFTRKIIMVAALAGAIGALAGCESDEVKKANNLQSLIESFFPPNQVTLVGMAFDQHDADRRRQGIELLSNSSNGFRDEYVRGYKELAKDPDPGVRAAAVKALGKSGRKDCLNDLVRAMSDKDDMVRWNAAIALDKIIGAEAIKPLREHAIGDSLADVKISCVKALRHYRNDEAFRTLVQCLDDDIFAVRYQAHDSLVQMTGSDKGYRPEDWGGATGGTLPKEKSRPAKKPWWDWTGVSKDEKPAKPDQPQSAPARNFPTQPATRARPGR